MDLPSNRAPENGLQCSENVRNAAVPTEKVYLNAFDLVKVGLSSTFAIAVFIGIGYVVRHVAGPSTIVSILLAAFIAYLVGAFYTEINTTIVLSAIKMSDRLSQVATITTTTAVTSSIENADDSKPTSKSKYNVTSEFLLPSYQIAYICNGEFVAFVIAWNLIMEYIVIVALISKALILFIDALFFGSVGHFNQIIPMAWHFSEYFDLLALLVPLVIGVPLLFLLHRNTIFNAVSIVLSLLVVLIFLVFGIFKADISNWNSMQIGNSSTDAILETGGFYAFGVDGVFRGVIISLFLFTAFDLMVLCRWFDVAWLPHHHFDKQQTIQNFSQTITVAILSINTAIFLSLLGMAFAITATQPLHSMDKSIPLLSVVDVVFSENVGVRDAFRFIILIAGCIALVGSLYAMLHAEQRVLQTMLSDSDDSTFKLFGKFGLSYLQQEIRAQFNEVNDRSNRYNNISQSTQRRRWRTCACLLFSILSGLLAGLFAIEHLINLLSIGTLLMLFSLTLNIMILRYSPHLKQRLHPQQSNGKSTTLPKSTHSMSLVSILLAIYCLLAATLTILIKFVASNTITISMTLFWIVVSILIAGLLAIIIVLGTQPKGNAIFSLTRSHPMFPAIVLFACFYLCTAIDVAAWVRLAVWMTIGVILYILASKLKERSRKLTKTGVINNGFVNETQSTSTPIQPLDDVRQSQEMLALEEVSSPNHEGKVAPSSSTNQPTTEVIPRLSEVQTNDSSIECVEIELEEMEKSPANELEVVPNVVSTAIVSETKLPQKSNLDRSKLNEISFVDDIKHICVERREPNGTAYFVEMDLVKNPPDPSTESPEESVDVNEVDCSDGLEKNMMERVLKQTNIEFRPEPLPVVVPAVSAAPADSVGSLHSEDSECEEEREVRAIVHAPNEVPPTVPGVIRPTDPSGKRPYAKRSPNFHIGVYEAIPKQKLLYDNDKHRQEFKMRLENLFNQNEGGYVQNRAKSNFNSPVARHSHRLSMDSQRLNHSISAPESLEISSDEIVSRNRSTEANPSKIPIPPVFNQQVYDTIGRRYGKPFASVSDMSITSDMSNGTTNDRTPPELTKKGNLSRTKAHENLTELNEHDEVGIKQKLEHILSKGRKMQANTTDLESNTNENIRRSKPFQPFDTVRKQKMLFSDVLKSIGPDIHANLHPTQTNAAIDIQQTQRRESLD